MRYLSLFSGIEAASCAWHPLGWELSGVCEIEKFPCNVLKHHYPDVPNLGDITQVGKAQLDALGSIDLIVGGSPCQGFSVAGKQEGLKDVRSKLAIDYLRVINTVKSKWIVWENVPGVFSTGKGMDFKLFTAALTHFGYGICWRVLDAQWFGVGQRRRRVFLVGYLGDWRPAYKVLFESQSLPGYFETLERKREDLARKAEARTGKTGTGTTCLNPWSEQSKRVLDINGKSDCLCASEKMKSITKILDDRPNTCYDMNHPCDVIRTYEDGKTPTLEARMVTGGNQIPLVFGEGSFYQYKEVAVGSTLKAAGGALGGGSENFVIGMNHIAEKAESVVIGKVCSHARVRKLTPKECLRLQGFPADWFDGVEGYSDTAAYKAIGNSMAVPCMRWIGERIQEVEKEQTRCA